jgi:cobalt/nickel transport protein
MNKNRRLWWGLVLLVFVSPLGLLLPEAFRSGPAWGEWSLGEIEKMVGFMPEGLKKWTNLWRAPFPEYNAGTRRETGLFHSSLGYILSGLLGAGAVVGVTLLLGKFLGKKNDRGRE